MIPNPSPELRTFLQALEGYIASKPRDLPEGALDTMGQLHQTLKGYTGPEQESPGEKEAREAASDIAVPYGEAAKGPDQPSPGQQEFDKAAAAFTQAVGNLASRT